MKIKIVLITLTLILLLACTTESVEDEYFGRFILTTRLTVDKLKWEGGNSRLNYTELCRDDGQLCFRGDDDLEYVYSKKYARLLVYNSKEIRLFNTKIGNKIECDLSRISERPKFVLYGYWTNSSLILFGYFGRNGERFQQTDVFSFNSGKCQLEKSFDSTGEIREFASQDPESGAVAWAICNKTNCTLKWLDSDFLISHQKEIGCNENSNLDIVWIDGVPEPRNRNGPKNSYCLNELGELKYPFTPPHSYVPDKWPDSRY
jgi:hypothetical protein